MRRQSQIEQDYGRLRGPESFQRAGPVFGQKNFVIRRQRPFHLRADFLVVVNNQQFGVHAFFSLKNTLKQRC